METAAEKAAAGRAAVAVAEDSAAEKVAAERAAAGRTAAENAAAEKVAVEKASTEKAVAERVASVESAAEKAAAKRVGVQRLLQLQRLLPVVGADLVKGAAGQMLLVNVVGLRAVQENTVGTGVALGLKLADGVARREAVVCTDTVLRSRPATEKESLV